MAKLTGTLVLEIMGRPAENVAESLKALVEKMSAEKGINLLKSTEHEPKPIKNSKDLFTAFAEIDIEFDSLFNYFGVLFAYMPSHIELISPESINIANNELNDFANAIIQKLHSYDAIAKKMIQENEILKQELYKVAPHLFKALEKEERPKKVVSKKKTKRKTKKR